jgi:hypothetical protein
MVNTFYTIYEYGTFKSVEITVRPGLRQKGEKWR